MQTLGNLTVPPTAAQIWLGQNAQPLIGALELSIDNLQNALAKFRGTNDNRTLIESLAVNVMERAQELAAVHSDDAAALARTAQFSSYRQRVMHELRRLDLAAADLSSDDAAVQFPLRMFRQALRQVRERLGALTESVDARPAVIAGVHEVLSRMNEISAMGAPLASWRYAAVKEKAQALLTTLAEAIPTAEPVVPVASILSFDAEHLSFRDAIEEFRSISVGYLGIDHDFQKIARAEVLGLLDGIIRQVNHDFASPLNKEELLPRIQEFQSRYLALERQLATTSDTPFLNPSREGAAYRAGQMSRLLAMVAPHLLTPKPEKSLLSRVGAAFSWEDQEVA